MKRNKYNILLVDDMIENVEILGTLLSKFGFKVSIATNGKEALELAGKNNFDLILLDIMMPEMDGYEVLEKLRSRPKTFNIPIIFLTGIADEESIVKGLKLGAQDYVTKPFNTRELRSRINTHIELHKARLKTEKANRKLEKKVLSKTNELEKANAELAQLQEAKTYFLELLAHELNTPVSLVLGNAERISKYTKSKRILEHLDSINEAGLRLKRFSDISLLITKLKTKHYLMNFVKYPISDILHSALYKLDKLLKSKNLTIIHSITDDDVPFNIDPILVEEVFIIILENSIKYSNENSKIRVIGKEIEDNFVFEFIDLGPGFSDKALKNIFNEFVAGNILYHKEGIGLGLVAAKLIVEAHSGKIKVENLEIMGAKVTISLPIKEFN